MDPIVPNRFYKVMLQVTVILSLIWLGVDMVIGFTEFPTERVEILIIRSEIHVLFLLWVVVITSVISQWLEYPSAAFPLGLAVALVLLPNFVKGFTGGEGTFFIELSIYIAKYLVGTLLFLLVLLWMKRTRKLALLSLKYVVTFWTVPYWP